MLRSTILMGLCGLLIGCTEIQESSPTSAAQARVSPMSPIHLDITQTGGFVLSITNKNKKSFVFSPRLDFVAVFYEDAEGKRIPMTWDGRNADMKLLSPFEVVHLLPNSTYVLRIPKDKVVQKEVLKQGGFVFGIVKPLRAGHFEAELQKRAAKVELLGQELVSQQVATPLALSDSRKLER